MVQVSLQPLCTAFDELMRNHKRLMKELEESAYYSHAKYDMDELHEMRAKLAEMSCCIDSISRQVLVWA